MVGCVVCCVTLLSLFPQLRLREEFIPFDVLLLCTTYGQRSLAGYSPSGHKGVRHDSVTHSHTHTYTDFVTA